jgi:hypothetical protein
MTRPWLVLTLSVEWDQKPANPCELWYGIATLVISSSEPSGCVYYPISFEALPYSWYR